MNEPQSWVKPLTRIPSSLKPLVATQKKHYGDVLHPTRWWG
ncbi:MAG: carboxymuconolactone decarboxylase family protein, partial [Citrobacter freundii]|nr:carboxymuconolactone decarboxylase family protein [Citrobacter freundii]